MKILKWLTLVSFMLLLGGVGVILYKEHQPQCGECSGYQERIAVTQNGKCRELCIAQCFRVGNCMKCKTNWTDAEFTQMICGDFSSHVGSCH